MEELTKKLNILLSDLNVLFRKVQNYHWYIEGEDFFQIHSKLEEYYDEIFKQIDEVAEHILIIGYEPLATMQDYLNTAQLVEAQNTKIKKEEIFSALVNDFEHVLKESKEIKRKAEEQNSVETSTFVDDLISDYGKKVWMLKQMMA